MNTDILQGKIESDFEDSFKSVDSESSASQQEENVQLLNGKKTIQRTKMESETFRLVELNESNWKSWSLKLESYLVLQGLWNTVKDPVPAEANQTKEWKEADVRALHLIRLRVSDKLIDIINKCKHAHDIYEQLRQHFEGSGNSRLALLFDRLFDVKSNPPRTIADISREFGSVVDEIQGMNLKPEEFYGYYYLHILPDRYQQAATSLRAAGNVTFERARDFLLQEERKVNNSNVTLAAMSKQKWKAGPKENKKKDYRCHKCGESGHFRKNCPQENAKANDQPKDAKDAKKNSLGSMKVYLNHVSSEVDDTGIAYHDNGVNDHLCNNKSWFTNMKPAFGTIEMPDGRTIDIIGQGDIYLSENDNHNLVLKNAKFAPGLKRSYICEYNLMRNGLQIKPFLDKTLITTKEGDVVATAKRIKGLLKYTRLKPVHPEVNSMEL